MFSKDCPCLSSADLKPWANCYTSWGQEGIIADNGVTCDPLTYGSNFCGKHDAEYDPKCKKRTRKNGQMNESMIPVPAYCGESWCYVDFSQCKLSSEVMYKRRNPETELFYSYSTCESSGEQRNDFFTTDVLESIRNLTVTVPRSYFPHHFKLNPLTGGVSDYLSTDEDYRNNSVPFHGAVIDYVNTIVGFSNDVERIDFVFRTGGADTLYPLSSFTASVSDVASGLSDMAVGPFWVTAERLRMTTFTTPVHMDQTLLVVKRPSVKDSFSYQIEKVLRPFSNGLWFILIATVFVVSCLSIWFASPHADNKRPWNAFRNSEWKKSSTPRRFFIASRQVLEAVMQNGMFVFGGGVSYDFMASLPYKVLMFGFSILILLVTSSYVANLAAFLTLSGISDYVHSMEQAIDAEIQICAHPGIKEELRGRWPQAQFVFSVTSPDYVGVLELYDAGKCSAMAIGITDVRYERSLMEKFCQRDVVFIPTAVVLEIPMAFPVRTELAAGISHWLYAGEAERGILFSQFYKHYEPDLSCSVEFDTTLYNNGNDLLPLTPNYMAFPFFVFSLCAGVAIVLKLCSKENTTAVAKFTAAYSILSDEQIASMLTFAGFFHSDDESVQMEARKSIRNLPNVPYSTIDTRSSNITKRPSSLSSSCPQDHPMDNVLTNNTILEGVIKGAIVEAMKECRPVLEPIEESRNYDTDWADDVTSAS